MAKELGQIHTVDYQLQNVANGDRGILDLPGQLSKILQHRVRAMSYFKVVGIDMAIVGSAGTLTGRLKYYAPTKGRVEALKQAWHATRDMLKLNGVKYWNNLNYDFRPIMTDPSNYTIGNAEGSDFLNQASLEAVGGVPGPLCLTDGPAGYKTVFDTYNEGIQPAQSAAIDFSSGFNVIEVGTAGDMVLNEGEYLASWVPDAQVLPEVIPWSLSVDYTDDGSTTDFIASTWNWRPDPALYLAVLTGQIELECLGSSASAEGNMDLSISIMVSGWKSIMGSDKKRRRSTKGGKTHHGRKRKASKR